MKRIKNYKKFNESIHEEGSEKHTFWVENSNDIMDWIDFLDESQEYMMYINEEEFETYEAQGRKARAVWLFDILTLDQIKSSIEEFKEFQ